MCSWTFALLLKMIYFNQYKIKAPFCNLVVFMSVWKHNPLMYYERVIQLYIHSILNSVSVMKEIFSSSSVVPNAKNLCWIDHVNQVKLDRVASLVEDPPQFKSATLHCCNCLTNRGMKKTSEISDVLTTLHILFLKQVSNSHC